jgi:hypothetical protein
MSPFSFLASEFGGYVLRWLLILLAWGWFSFGIWQDHRQMRDLSLPPHLLALMRAQLHRHQQAWALLSLMLAFGFAQEWRVAQPLLSAETAPAPALPAPVTPAAPSPAPGAAAPASRFLFTDIPQFDEKNAETQAHIDWLKERYESWLVTFRYLERCGQAQKADEALIRSELMSELRKSKAPREVYDNILTAAKGSYEELYRHAACDENQIRAIRSGYEQDMQNLTNRLSGEGP